MTAKKAVVKKATKFNGIYIAIGTGGETSTGEESKEGAVKGLQVDFGVPVSVFLKVPAALYEKDVEIPEIEV